MSSNIGKKFYPREDFIGENGKRFFSGANDLKRIDSASQEAEGVRYHLTWKKECRYSILVDAHGTVVSWRRESPDQHGCYVF
jgi:hypothetical protein